MIEAKILSNAIKFADSHKSIYTGCIHYKNEREMTRDVIPLTENILYGISLVTTYSLEKAEAGLAFLERLFKFITEDGFPGAMHDFPHVYNDRSNVEICLALTFFLKNYSKVIPSAHRFRIEAVRSNLISILKKRSLKPLDRYMFQTSQLETNRDEIEIKTLPEYEKVTLCKLLMGERVTLPWHKVLDVYTGPLLETFYRDHEPLSSLFTQLIHNEGENHMSLFAALLPRTGWQELISFEEMERDDLFVNHREDLLSIHFDSHSLVARGDLDVKVTGDHIDIFLDPFEEIDFLLTDSEESSILVDGITATAFYPQDTIILTTESKVITVRFTSKSHDFMGHIMKGSRPNQISDTSKNFTLFDHRIHLKKV